MLYLDCQHDPAHLTKHLRRTHESEQTKKCSVWMPLVQASLPIPQITLTPTPTPPHCYGRWVCIFWRSAGRGYLSGTLQVNFGIVKYTP